MIVRKSILFIGAALVAFLITLTGCEHAEAPTGPGNGVQAPDFDSIQVAIFSQTCAPGCHEGSNPAGGMNLSEGEAYDNIVEVRSRQAPEYFRVEPNNPDSSYIIMKLEGSDKIVGQRMPAGGRGPLSQEKIDAIREWIDEGASQ